MNTSRSILPACNLLCVGLLLSGAALAAPPATSPYVVDAQSSHVEDATSSGIGEVNMITCIMSAMRPEALVNQGNYNALVDEAKCSQKGDSSSAGSAAGGDAATAPSYMTAVVNATRASNSDPMISKIWIVQEEDGKQSFIDVHVSAVAAPTTTNPYGQFQLYYCGHDLGSSTCRMNGYLEGNTSGVRYFHTENRDDGQGPYVLNSGLNVTATGTTSGSGKMFIDDQSGQQSFDFAYNSSLYRRADGNAQQCFSRDASDPETGLSVWRYGLYDATTGERITRNSGFPIDFTNSGQTWHGYLGYSGLSLPSAAMAVLTNGSTVQRVTYSGQGATKTDFTVVKAGGRLLKFTRLTRTLKELDGISFTTFVGNDVTGFFAGATSNTQYELHWDDAAGNFKVTSMFACSPGGCQTQALPAVQTVSAAYWLSQSGVQGWSMSLGGELFINLRGLTLPLDSAQVQVAYRTQDLVYPSQLPDTLYCVRDCPTNASMAAYFAPGTSATSPFAGASANNFQPTALAGVVTYHSDPVDLLRDALSAPLTLADPSLFKSSAQYQNGMRSGRLVTTLAGVECSTGSNTYCDFKANDLDVYYQWETGADSFNQFAAVKDSNGTFVTFDPPLLVNYSVPAGSGFGEYAGKSMVLQYGGFGDLWGIPGQCVSRVDNTPVACDNNGNARYVPAFVIPYDGTTGQVTSGSTTYLVKWLDREIRFAHKPLGVCDAAQLSTPTGVVLPTSALLKNPADPASDIYIGVKPVVTSAARVIQGELKY